MHAAPLLASGSATATTVLPTHHRIATDAPPVPAVRGDSQQALGQRIAHTLELLAALNPQRRIVRAGEVLYQGGETFSHLHVLNSGFFKLVSLSADGREQVVGLKLRGDWLGFSGIARGRYACEAIAMDTAEVWSVRYDALLRACAQAPELMALVHEAMSGEIMRDRDSLLSVCTLPADARVAEFLSSWARSLADRGLRIDQISLRLTRAEIGNYLGMTLETVSRALSRLARAQLIAFPEKTRRDISIPDVLALEAYIQGHVTPAELH